MIAEAYSKNVVNVLTFGPVGAQEVLLEVKFAEVDRSALTQLGINLVSTGATNTVGTTTTQQFGGFGTQQITDEFPRPPGTVFTSNQTIQSKSVRMTAGCPGTKSFQNSTPQINRNRNITTNTSIEER